MITEEGQAPTSYAPGRNLAMLKAVNPIELIKRKHLARNDDHLSLSAIRWSCSRGVGSGACAASRGSGRRWILFDRVLAAR